MGKGGGVSKEELRGTGGETSRVPGGGGGVRRMGLVPDVVNDLEGWLDMRHMLAEVAQGCGLSNLPMSGMQGSVSRDHV